jgi:transcriptional regulator with XRE-family HTH domain
MNGQAVKAILGKNIKFLRSRKGLTQAVLAEKADISIIFLSSIERGAKYPQADILARIAKILKVEVFELFKGDLLPSDGKEWMTNLTRDITKQINSSLDDIFKLYLG